MNKIDRAVIYVPINKCQITNSMKFEKYCNSFDRYSSLKIHRTKSEMYRLEFTGKLGPRNNKLWLWSEENIDLCLQIIEDKAGIIIDKDAFLNADLTQADFTEDIIVKKRKLFDILSTIRELAYKKTSKNLIFSYKNELGYENSLLIRSSCKTVKDSLTIYTKFDEMYKKRRKDNGYYESFSLEALEEIKNVLRFERRIAGKKQLLRALHLPYDARVNLKAVLECRYILVKEKIKLLTGI